MKYSIRRWTLTRFLPIKLSLFTHLRHYDLCTSRLHNQMDVCSRTDADMNMPEDLGIEGMYRNLQRIRREMQIMKLTIWDLSKLTTQLIFTLDKYRVKRNLEENVCCKLECSECLHSSVQSPLLYHPAAVRPDTTIFPRH